MAEPSERQAHIDLLRYPEGLRSSGDPSPGNPFRNDDPRHGVWADATRRAEQEIRAVNAVNMGGLDDDQSSNPDEARRAIAAHRMQLVISKFDIWAKRTVHVIWREADEQAFAKWLEHYAKVWLNEIKPGLIEEIGNIDWVLDELRIRLIARIEYWKSEARRCLNEQAQYQNASASLNRGGSLKSDKIIPAPPPAIASPQQAWNLIREDVALRESLMVQGWGEQRHKNLNRVWYEARRSGNSAYYLPARIEMEVRDTSERAQALFDACCEVWDSHGFPRNRVFYRAVFDNCLELLFGTRPGDINAELALEDGRRNAPGRSSAAQSAIAQRIKQLRSDWNTKLEIAGRESEIRERAARARNPQRPTVPLHLIPVTSDQAWELMEGDFQLRKLLIDAEMAQQLREETDRLYGRKRTSEAYIDGRASLELKNADETAERYFQACCDIIEMQGRPNCWFFFQAISHYCLIPLFNQRKATLSCDLRIRHPEPEVADYLVTTQRSFARKMEKLQSQWETKIEIAFRNNEHQQRKERDAQALTTVKLRGQTRSNGRLKPRTKSQEKRLSAIVAVLQLGFKGPRYCIALDERKIQVPESWKEDGCPVTYVAAYRSGDPWRKRIQDEKYRYQRNLMRNARKSSSKLLV